MPGLYHTTWYNGEKFEYTEGFISNRENFMVGMPRMRQARIRPGKITNYCMVLSHKDWKLLNSRIRLAEMDFPIWTGNVLK